MSLANLDTLQLTLMLISFASILFSGLVYVNCIKKLKELRGKNKTNAIEKGQENVPVEAEIPGNLSDFRDPVTLIIGYSDKLKFTLQDENSVKEVTIINQNARKILNLMDGIHSEVEVISAPQEINPEENESLTLLTDSAEVEEADKSKIKLLIIDDDYAMRQYVRSMFVDNYIIFEASDGSEGLEKTLKLFPDLVISDIRMPNMDGIEFCKRIKKDLKTSHIPVILLTSCIGEDQRINGFEVGADYYIGKPFNTLELTLRVKNLLETLNNQRKKYAGDIFQTPRQITSNSTDEKFLSEVISFVEANIEDPELDIAVLASKLNMSSSNLYKKIKSITGMSSIDFVMNHKMKYAAHLLLSDKHSIKAIAYMVGFTDSRYFSTRFKKYFNATPTEYKERFEKENQLKETEEIKEG